MQAMHSLDELIERVENAKEQNIHIAASNKPIPIQLRNKILEHWGIFVVATAKIGDEGVRYYEEVNSMDEALRKKEKWERYIEQECGMTVKPGALPYAWYLTSIEAFERARARGLVSDDDEFEVEPYVFMRGSEVSPNGKIACTTTQNLDQIIERVKKTDKIRPIYIDLARELIRVKVEDKTIEDWGIFVIAMSRVKDEMLRYYEEFDSWYEAKKKAKEWARYIEEKHDLLVEQGVLPFAFSLTSDESQRCLRARGLVN